MTDKQELQQALQALAVHYAAELPAKTAEIESRMRALLGGNADAADLPLLHRQLHSLHGSAKTFGFPAVSEAARELEALVAGLAAGTLDAQSSRNGAELLARLLSATQAPNALLAPPAGAPATPPRELTARLIYLVEDDAAAAATLSQQLKTFGYSVLTFETAEAVAEACARAAPSAIISDLKFSARISREAGPSAANGGQLETPLVFLSDTDDMESRLQAARAWGDAFFAKPARIGPLVDRLDALLNPAAAEPYRVLIVEDAAEQAEYYSAILRDAGMRCQVVTDPLRLVEALNDFNPELVLMDMYLPGCTGDELAQVIRQNASFMSLPIVFLSVEQDFDRQLRAMFRGGDEFLTKPLSPQHLALVATSRVERYRELRVLMLHDSLTGLVNHSRLQQQLEIESARTLRQRQALSLAMIDIDHFKQVNDRHGHQTGDRVLKNLARFLRQRLRASDVIGRYGGEEFAVILTDTAGAVAEEVINSLRRDFAAIPHETGGDAISVTFSAGIAALPGHASVRELILAADQALYAAKSAGRNRVKRASGA
jgi:diguanylate cyclase (GGDEF)-like protein